MKAAGAGRQVSRWGRHFMYPGVWCGVTEPRGTLVLFRRDRDWAPGYIWGVRD